MTGALGRTVTALRLGLATTRGRSGAVHRWALVVASFLGVLVAWSFVALYAVADHRTQRLLDRDPAFTTEDQATAAYWHYRIDYARDRQFLVIFVAPLAPDALPPPGLPRWPEPGEAFVSKALLAADVHARDRYGTYAGSIGNEGLSDSTEWLVYARPPDLGSFTRIDHDPRVSGFGESGREHPSSSLPGTITSAEPFWLLVVAVAVPAGVLLVVAVRTGADRRDRRLALLDSLGLPLAVRAWLLPAKRPPP